MYERINRKYYIDLMKIDFDILNQLSVKYKTRLLYKNILEIELPYKEKNIITTGIIKKKKLEFKQLMTDNDFKNELKNVNIHGNNIFSVFNKPVFNRYLKKYGIEHIEEIVIQISLELNEELSKELLDKFNHIKKE